MIVSLIVRGGGGHLKAQVVVVIRKSSGSAS